MAHLHSVYDTDSHFSINPITRAIRNESGIKTSLVQYDHDSERFTFELPRYIESHDMSLCDRVEVHYINIGTNKQSEDVYVVDDVLISPDDNNVVIFSWLISGNATKYAGSLNFLIRFVCLDGGKIEYAWHTEIYSGISVSKGMNNGEAVIAEFPDVLETWKQKIYAEFTINFEAERDAAIAEIEAKGVATLATIPEDYTALNNQCAKNTFDIAASASRIDRNDKRITNIEKGITPEPYETDASVAYIKDVPAEALPYAEVNTIGGMTRKCTNLLSLADGTYTDNGVTTTVKNQRISFSGVAKAATWTILGSVTLNVGSYKFSCPQGIKQYLNVYLWRDGSSASLISGNLTVETAGTYHIIVQISDTTNDSSVFGTIQLMLNSGDTALPYEPYFEGLRSAPVTEVESVGANLFDVSDINIGFNGNLSSQHHRAISARIKSYDTTISIRANSLPSNLKYMVYGYRSSDWNDAKSLSEWITDTNARNISIAEYPYFAILFGSVDDTTLTEANFKDLEFMVNFGSTALPCTPYQRNTLPIPEAVRPAHGINDKVYDYIDFGEQESVKRVGEVDLGTLEWFGQNGSFYAEVANIKYPSYGKIPNVITAIHTVVGAGGSADIPRNPDKSITTNYVLPNINIRDTAYTDAATFKAAMSGVMLYYELATPEVTDISDILPADNYIGVEGNGTLTFKNEYKYDVPSEVTYITKGAESE